jgi:hypothetical protein
MRTPSDMVLNGWWAQTANANDPILSADGTRIAYGGHVFTRRLDES